MKYLIAHNRGTHLLHVNSVYCTVKRVERTERFYKKVAFTIASAGMVNPIVVYKCLAKEWRGPFFNQSEDMEKAPFDLQDDRTVHLAMCGNNRLRAARKLNYDYIECIVKEDLEEVSRICGRQRKDWDNELRNRFAHLKVEK